MVSGSVLIKPKTDYGLTVPDIYRDGVTYVSCRVDYGDLKEKIDEILNNYDKYKKMLENIGYTNIQYEDITEKTIYPFWLVTTTLSLIVYLFIVVKKDEFV